MILDEEETISVLRSVRRMQNIISNENYKHAIEHVWHDLQKLEDFLIKRIPPTVDDLKFQLVCESLNN